MNMIRKQIFSAMALLLAGGMTGALADDVFVDMGTRGVDIPPSMYGVFFEEINHAGDGGLYAELLQNRGFEEQDVPRGCTYKDGAVYAPHAVNYYYNGYSDWHIGWDLEGKKYTGWTFSNKNCTISKDVLTPDKPLDVNTPNALRLVISNARTGAQADVINTGYWGVAVQSGATYKVRFYLRTSDYKGDVKAFIGDASGNDIGSKTFSVTKDGTWKEYTAEITASRTVTDGKFHLQFAAAGTVYVDYVSLFPTDTYCGRENGPRKDLAQFVADLKPAFIRWPGGCIVEGITLDNRVRWKETLGDPMQRRGEYSLWGYRSSWGLGYHEFLQMCEDMHTQGMFVDNVGLACCFRNGDFIPAIEDSLKDYVQDISDAIEYAIGDVNTTWGKKRAEAGHPAPFPLKYVELGNENWGERYGDRFAFFYGPLKKKWPQIKFINTLSGDDNWGTPETKKSDYYDIHFYQNADYYYNNALYFEKEKRGDFKTYVGEYNANDGDAWGSMNDALSEAVFMGDMERNADYVDMASYAPLLINVNAMSFPCNLIGYNNNKVYGRASYYVQKMYSNNRPDFNVKTRIYASNQTKSTEGRVGVGTINAQAEFRNLKVSKNDGTRTYYTSDFLARPDEWTEGGGTWVKTNDNTYKQTSTADGTAVSLMNEYSFCNSTLEVEARKISGKEGIVVMFGGSKENTGNGYRFTVGGWGNTKAAVEKVVDGRSSTISDLAPMTLKTSQWYKIKIVMHECKDVMCYVDDKLVCTATMPDLLTGRVQAFGGYDRTTGEIVVKVVNAVDSVMNATVHINGENIQPTGKIITLTSTTLKEENSVNEPTKIAPVEETFNGFAKEFTYQFKPRSLTLMRIKADSAEATQQVYGEYNCRQDPVPLYGAETALSMAKSKLQRLVSIAKANLVESASFYSQLSSATTKASNVLTDTKANMTDIKSATTTLSARLAQYFKSAMVTDNEVTSKMKNPNFTSMSTDGWQGTLPGLERNVAEFYNTRFDSYQTITGLENGYYLIYLQGYYRFGGPVEKAYATYIEGGEQLNAYLYGNDKQVALGSVFENTFSFGSWNGYCNWRAEAEQAFNTSADTYANYLMVKVTNGTLKLGLRKSTVTDCDWCCFNNFRLFYMPKATKVTAAIMTKQTSNNIYDLSGRRCSKDNLKKPNIYIEDGHKVLEK
jgi:alpha-N-arabinofuranosidase